LALEDGARREVGQNTRAYSLAPTAWRGDPKTKKRLPQGSLVEEKMHSYALHVGPRKLISKLKVKTLSEISPIKDEEM